eukprot:4753064-Amphidinium_carterae.1
MYEYFHDEHLISNVLSLHEGVLVWMELDDIKDLEERAKGDSDPEATRDYSRYLDENNNLDTKLRRDFENEHGKLEDIEEYQQAVLDKDSEGLKAIIYQYAKDIRERKLAWKELKIIEENKRKDKYRRELLRERAEEKERQRKKRAREQGEQAAASMAVRSELQSPMTFNAKNKIQDPPMPTRPPLIPAVTSRTTSTSYSSKTTR